MKRIILLLAGTVLTLSILTTLSCSKKGSDPETIATDSVLINIGNNIILPAYRTMTGAANSLDAAIIDFNASPDATKLANVQTLFKNAYIALQSVSPYDGFGPAVTIHPNLSGLNLFPVATTKIDSNIVQGNYNVNVLSSLSAKGFPALDYLLFGSGSNTLANYTTDVNAASRKLYLAAVSADIKTGMNAALNGWEANGGNYIGTFVKGTGNSISGSLGLLINSMDQDIEILKNDRFGIPLGKQPPGSSLPILPKEVEAYYSGISMQLALAQLKTAQQIYLGTTTGNGVPGLQDYLVKVNARYNGGTLADTIKAHFEKLVVDMAAIPDPFSITIQNNPAPANAVYVQLQQLVVLLKTDLPSSLGILITYGDNDGD